MISILHPSRGRPKQAYETATKWLANAGCDVEYVLSLDADDTSKYHDHFPPIFEGLYLPFHAKDKSEDIFTNIQINKNRSAIDAINQAAKISTGNILIQIADDFDCPPLWGKQIIDATQGKTDWIMKTPDGIQDWIITLPIMDRAYYNRFGYVYYWDYLHMFCDTEMTCVADLTGRKITADIPFVHNHYSVGKSPKDAINDKADATWNQGERLFLERYKRNFDLPLKDLQGRITNQGYLNWINGKL